MRRSGFAAFAALAIAAVACSSVSDPAPTPWKLAWSDEFDGQSLDTSRWSFDTGSDFSDGGGFDDGGDFGGTDV